MLLVLLVDVLEAGSCSSLMREGRLLHVMLARRRRRVEAVRLVWPVAARCCLTWLGSEDTPYDVASCYGDVLQWNGGLVESKQRHCSVSLTRRQAGTAASSGDDRAMPIFPREQK